MHMSDGNCSSCWCGCVRKRKRWCEWRWPREFLYLCTYSSTVVIVPDDLLQSYSAARMLFQRKSVMKVMQWHYCSRRIFSDSMWNISDLSPICWRSSNYPNFVHPTGISHNIIWFRKRPKCQVETAEFPVSEETWAVEKAMSLSEIHLAIIQLRFLVQHKLQIWLSAQWDVCCSRHVSSTIY